MKYNVWQDRGEEIDPDIDPPWRTVEAPSYEDAAEAVFEDTDEESISQVVLIIRVEGGDVFWKVRFEIRARRDCTVTKAQMRGDEP